MKERPKEMGEECAYRVYAGSGDDRREIFMTDIGVMEKARIGEERRNRTGLQFRVDVGNRGREEGYETAKREVLKGYRTERGWKRTR